jgi:Fur family transcriptional regulator, ferric uptake regulator
MKRPGKEDGGSLTERMRSRGVRLTGQRRLLADLLEKADAHLDAETVFRLARRRDPGIHRATVYRTLNRLKRLGLVDELDLMHVTGERHFYEIRPSAFHIHLVCTSCGRVEEPEGAFWEELRQKVERETGFAPDVVRLEMGGLCTKCRGRGRKSRSRPSSKK